MINYEWQSADEMKVFLDGKVIGHIRRITAGALWQWQYTPKGSKTGGDLFATIIECKRSLEG